MPGLARRLLMLRLCLVAAIALVLAPAWADPSGRSPAKTAAPLQPRLYSLAADALAPLPAASAARIAVIYPNLAEPYRSVFRQILSGIEQTAPTRVVRIALEEGAPPQPLAAQLQSLGIGAVIALGRHGLEAARTAPAGMPVVGGAVLASPDDNHGARTLVSLTPDPRLLFQHLKRLAPQVRRVFAVYSARQNGWLMTRAQEAARMHGLELVQIETDDRRVALGHFHAIAERAEPGRDAIWLPQDSAVLDDEVVLPYVLQAAWDRSITVFSSTLAHVRRGALFALYPDNVDMGRQLAATALDLVGVPPPTRSVQPLREVHLALNTRTARHLGVNLETVEKDVVLLFPVR
jgi:putative ABC transport system substrate-binding protein